MKRILIAVLFLSLLGCNAEADDLNTLVFVAQGPRDEHPYRGYEIEFFSDGIIKRIRRFQLSGNIDLYQWDSSSTLVTLVSEFVTEWEESKIVQYEVDASGEKIAISTFEMNESGRIDFDYHERNTRYQIEYNGNLDVFLKDGSDRVLQGISYRENEILLLSPTVDYREISRISQSELKEFSIVRSDIELEAEVSYDGDNLYSIAIPDSYGEVPYDVKVTLLAPGNRSFSQNALVLNRFITFVINTREATYLLPFLSQNLIR